MQCSSSNSTEEHPLSAIDPGVLENRLSGNSYRWFSSDHHQVLEQMPELVHGHGSNDGEIDADADTADLDFTRQQLLDRQEDLFRLFDFTQDPFAQSRELNVVGDSGNPLEKQNEGYLNGDKRSPKLENPLVNVHASMESWNSYRFGNLPASELMQRRSLSPHHPKGGVIPAGTHIVDDTRALPSSPLHTLEGVPSDSFQCMFPPEPFIEPLDQSWPRDFSIPPTQAAEWGQLPLISEDFDGGQEILAGEDFQSAAIPQDQSLISPGIDGTGNGTPLQTFPRFSSDSYISDASQVEAIRYREQPEREFIFKEESVEGFYVSSPISSANHSIIGKPPFEEDDQSVRFPASVASVSSDSLPVAQGSSVGDVSHEKRSNELNVNLEISRPRASSASFKRAKWRGTPNLPLSVIEAENQKHEDADNTIELPAQAPSLQIVQEDGQGGSISSSTYRMSAAARARRNGPLSNTGRRDAALRRKHKNVCVWCRLAKKKVTTHFNPAALWWPTQLTQSIVLGRLPMYNMS